MFILKAFFIRLNVKVRLVHQKEDYCIRKGFQGCCNTRLKQFGANMLLCEAPSGLSCRSPGMLLTLQPYFGHSLAFQKKKNKKNEIVGLNSDDVLIYNTIHQCQRDTIHDDECEGCVLPTAQQYESSCGSSSHVTQS